MIIVFVPSMMLAIFTIYSLIKVFTFHLKIGIWTYFSVFLWNLFLIAPAIVAIYIGAATTSKGKVLCNQIGKFSSYCCDDYTLNRVRQISLKCIHKIIWISIGQLNTLHYKIYLRPIVLSCGFFNIDWPLGLSIFGTVTTYMIIICQFEEDY